MKIIKFVLFVVFVAWVSARDTKAQYIFYGKPVENLSVSNRFLVLGDLNGETLVYYVEPTRNAHTIGYYDKKMKLLRQRALPTISTSNKVISIQRLVSQDFAIIHTATDVSRQKQNCYISKWSPSDNQIKETKLVESISYNSEESIFQVAQSPSHTFFNVFVFGQKSQDTSAIISHLFNDKGEQVKQGINFFTMGIYSTENLEKALLNDQGDLFFYSTLVDKFGRYMYAKLFFQTKDQKTLTSQYTELTHDKVEITALKPFYNPVTKRWNLMGVYQYTEQKDFSQGFRLLSWECTPTSSLANDYWFSFAGYLDELKKRIEPYFFEDIALNTKKIKNKSLIDLIKQLPKEEEESDEEESEETQAPEPPRMIDEDEEVLTQRIQSLLELFSFGKVEIMDVVIKSDGDFTLFLENRPNKKDNIDNPSFVSRVSPSLVMGFGGGVSTGYSSAYGGGMGVGLSIPLAMGGDDISPEEVNTQNTGVRRLNDLTIMDFSSDGQFRWGVNLNKNQSSNLGDNLSYFSIKKKDEIYIFYVNQGAPSYVYSILVSPTGQMQVKPTVRGTSAAYSMIPVLSHQTSVNATVVPCLFKDKLVFSRLVYE